MKTIIIYVIALFLCSVPLKLSAMNIWSKHLTVYYTLGDLDSRASARKIAIEKLKVKASASVGSYITTRKVLSGQKFSKKITVIAESIVRLSDIKEKFNVKGDALVLVVSATAHVDQTILDKRIKKLQNNKEANKKMDILVSYNDNLLAQLATINDQLQLKAIDQREVAQLQVLQQNLRSEVINNRKTVNGVFSQAIVAQKVSQSDNAYQSLVNHVNKHFFEPLMTITPTVSVDSAVKRMGNDGYNIMLSVDWDSSRTASPTLFYEMFLNERERKVKVGRLRVPPPNIITVPQPMLNRDIDTQSMNAKFFLYLSQQTVNIEITLGKKMITLPVFWMTTGKRRFNISAKKECYSRKLKVFSKQRAKRKYVCFTAIQNKSGTIRTTNNYKTSNPILFHVSQQEYEQLSSLNVKLVRLDLTTTTQGE